MNDRIKHDRVAGGVTDTLEDAVGFAKHMVGPVSIVRLTSSKLLYPAPTVGYLIVMAGSPCPCCGEMVKDWS